LSATSALLNVGQAGANGKTGTASPRDTAGDAGAEPFERWMRPAQANDKPATRAGTADRPPASAAAKPAARETAADTAAADGAVDGNAQTAQARNKPAAARDEEAAPAANALPWLRIDTPQPFGAVLPIEPENALAAAPDAMTPTDLLDAAALPGAPAGPAPLTPSAGEGEPAMPALVGTAIAGPLPQAAADTDAPLPATSAATDAPAAPTAEPRNTNTAAVTTLPGLLTFAQQLATQPQAAPALDALVPLRDLSARMESDAGADAEPLPGLNPLAGAPSPSLGLARTATVNPLEAPMPHLRSEQFDEAIGTRLSWMADQKIGHAHIRVNPSELGAIDIRLRLDGDRVHADFSSALPEVRQALENSLPRLRDMLGQQGFHLAQADVGHQQQPDRQPGTAAAAGHGSDDAGGPASHETQITTPTRLIHRGLLDAYA